MKKCSSLFYGALRQKLFAFSLVEMLMALLVASLLLAALAPVITRRMNENIHITGDMTLKGDYEVKEIIFGGPECPNIIYDTNNNPLYCEGEYVVPEGVSNITVTAIGGGGGGGTAPTAGFIEYTTAGSTNTFTVPAMVNQIEATLVSGGAGGGAGGQVLKTHTFVTTGNGNATADANNYISTNSPTYTWNVPQAARGKYSLVTACGGGGGGGGIYLYNQDTYGGGGGSGGYLHDIPVQLPNTSALFVLLGGGGGGGGGGGKIPIAGPSGGGGGGGHTQPGGSAPLVDGQVKGGNGGSSAAAMDATAAGDGENGAGAKLTGGGRGGLAYNYNALAIISGAGAGGGGGLYGGGGGGGTIWTGCGVSGGGGGGGGPTYLSTATTNFIHIGGGGGGGGSGANGGCTFWKEYLGGEIGDSSAGGGGGGGGGYGAGGGGGGGGVSGNAAGGYASGACETCVGIKSSGQAGSVGESHNTPGVVNEKRGGGGGGGFGGASGSGWGSGAGGKISTIFGDKYCNGGNGAIGGSSTSGEMGAPGSSGKDGAIRISYLDYGPGGSGGGSGAIVPIRHINNLRPNDGLTVKIADKSKGIPAGSINSSGKIIYPMSSVEYEGTRDVEVFGKDTSIAKENKEVLLRTSYYGGWYSPNPGVHTGACNISFTSSAAYLGGLHGHITDGIFASESSHPNKISVTGFSVDAGNTAGNGAVCVDKVFANGTIGGDGGTVTTPWFICVPGKGGTKDNPKGKDATGFGCGGGGGYGLADGGKGSGGYARLSWNMYWDTALNSGKGDYRYSESGTGGGGASGNAITETVRVAEKQTIKIRIGAGGMGAKVVNGEIIPATSGGTTIFGDNNFIEIKAGGGGGGASPSVIKNGDTSTLINGKGGEPSTVCDVGSHKYLNNKNRCTKGNPGKNPGDDDTSLIMGGIGGAFSLTVNGKTYTGTPGTGGIQSTEISNSSGKTPENSIASGGGGAALLIYRNGVSDISLLANPQGGNGANGRMILKLWK